MCPTYSFPGTISRTTCSCPPMKAGNSFLCEILRMRPDSLSDTRAIEGRKTNKRGNEVVLLKSLIKVFPVVLCIVTEQNIKEVIIP